ncbi:hypothetical protein [Streptomyces sp. f150]|uniref:hypothetical protein n=1 Tax=Streptomyces sp. f150 TaxID=1827699 RepID=UPI000BEF8D1B|nr:hypothetical protein [Streptomyces sp. f150]
MYGQAQGVADAIAQLAVEQTAATPAVRGGDWRMATVATVGTDGTVTTTDGIVARRLETYPAPLVGDVIRIDQSGAGSWLAVGRTVSTTGDGWTALTLSGAWVPNGGATDAPPSARVRPDGELQLSGMIKGVAVNAGGSASVGLLPAGVSTSYWVRGVSPTSIAQNYVRVDVNPTGAITLVNGSVALLATSWVVLDGARGRAR